LALVTGLVTTDFAAKSDYRVDT